MHLLGAVRGPSRTRRRPREAGGEQRTALARQFREERCEVCSGGNRQVGLVLVGPGVKGTPTRREVKAQMVDRCGCSKF